MQKCIKIFNSTKGLAKNLCKKIISVYKELIMAKRGKKGKSQIST